MAYELRAVVGRRDLVERVVADLPGGIVAGLHRGLALIPLTDEVEAALDRAEPAASADEAPRGAFPGVPRGLDRLLARWSAEGPVAFVDLNAFGGMLGPQQAVVWEHGSPVLGPFSGHLGERRRSEWPVNATLARLGVTRRDGEPDPETWDDAWDLFDVVGLGRWRKTERWAQHAERNDRRTLRRDISVATRTRR